MATAVAHEPEQVQEQVDQYTQEAHARADTLQREVLAIARARRDAKVDTRALTAVATVAGDNGLATDAERIVIKGGGARLALTDLAHDQLAERVGVPKVYYRRMLAAQPELLCENLNTWLHNEPDTRLLRCLMGVTEPDHQMLARTGANMKVRGIMGATYRVMDDAEVLAPLMLVAREHGALLASYDLTDTRLHAKFVTAPRSTDSIRQRVLAQLGSEAAYATRTGFIQQHQVMVGEVMRTGFYVRNSGVGFAMLDVASYAEILKCVNGMIVPSEVKVRHAGGRHGVQEAELSWLSDTTQELDNAALYSRLRDAALAAVDDRAIVKLANTVAAAKMEPVALPVPLFEWLDAAADKLELNEVQRDLYKQETTLAMAQERAEGVMVIGAATTTQFALVQGLTALARQVVDTDRRAELERTGWSWLEGTTQQLVAAGEAVARKRRR